MAILRKRPDPSPQLFTRVRQFCTVVDDFEATVERLVDHLGIGPFRCWHFRAPVLYDTTFRGQPAAYEMKLAITWLDDVQYEVIQPIAGPTLYGEHLAARGRGVQHILMDTAPTPFAAAVARLTAAGHPFDQTARVNARVKIGRLSLPPLPARLAQPASLHFGYLDLERELGSAVELTRYPLGFSERFALRAGRPEWCIPAGMTNFERPLPSLRVARAGKATIVTRDLDRTLRGWQALAGVGGWRLTEVARGGFGARVAQADVGDTLLELVEPGAGASPWHDLVATRGEVVATVGLVARGGYDALLAHLRGLGYAVPWEGALVGDRRSAFVAARRLLGTDLEILEP